MDLIKIDVLAAVNSDSLNTQIYTIRGKDNEFFS